MERLMDGSGHVQRPRREVVATAARAGGQQAILPGTPRDVHSNGVVLVAAVNSVEAACATHQAHGGYGPAVITASCSVHGFCVDDGFDETIQYTDSATSRRRAGRGAGSLKSE